MAKEKSNDDSRITGFPINMGRSGRRDVEWGSITTDAEEEDETSKAMPIVSLVYRRFALGIAYYAPAELTLYVTEDIPCATPETCHDIVDSVLASVSPSLALTSVRSDTSLLVHLKEGTTPHVKKLVVHVLPGKEFSYILGKKIFQLVADHSAFDETRFKCGFTVLPPLFDHISRTISPNFEAEVLSDDGRATDQADAYRRAVQNVELISWDQWMWIGGDGAESLQIFHNTKHANSFEKKIVEGLSLFGLLNQTSTSMGSSLLRTWLQRPSRSIDCINSRLDAVQMFLAVSENLTNEMRKQLKGAKIARKNLMRVVNGTGRYTDWRGIWQFLYISILVHDCIMGCISENIKAGEIKIIKDVVQKVDTKFLKELGSMISDIIDWDESKAQRPRICVRSGVDDILDEKSSIYAGLDNILSKVAQELSKSLPIQEFNCVYFPQLGFLCALPIEQDWDEKDLKYPFPGSEWEFQFNTEKFAYYKSAEMRYLDTDIGDIYTHITGREIEIIQSLQQQIVKVTNELFEICSTFAELDVLLCFAHISKKYGYNRPNMTEDNVCKIKQGRHPLVELTVNHYIRNDAALRGGQGVPGMDDSISTMHDDKSMVETLDPDQSMLILTALQGANFSGKSVFLKQVALIVVMAHIGCFVPAQSALIGITDRIITRVQTKESVAKPASAFMIDLQQVCFMYNLQRWKKYGIVDSRIRLRNATDRSLLIIDEFGKGTDSSDGAALFTAVVEHLLERGSSTPKCLVATHHHNIFTNKLLNLNLPMSLAHMEVMVPPQQPTLRHSEAQITYLYRLRPGLVLTSHAALCASLFGISDSILDRAAKVTDCINRFALVELLDDTMTERERIELIEGEELIRKFLEWDLDQEDEGGAESLLCQLRSILQVEDSH